jgi:hypothetical protein
MNEQRGQQRKPRVQERDERWMLIALVVLVVAYVVYRLVTASQFELAELGIDIDGFDFSALGRAGAVIPYLATVLIGILTQVVKRARNATARREMEERASREGVLASDDSASWREVSSEGELGRRRRGRAVLTRAALYLFDAGSGAPTRFPFTAPEPGRPAIMGATTRRGERGVVLELMLTGHDGAMRIEVADTSHWVTAVARAAGRKVESLDEAPAEATPSDGDTSEDDDSDDLPSWLRVLGG